MKLSKIISTIFLILFIPIFLISCTSKENKLEKIKETGQIVLGTSADYPPYEFPLISPEGVEKIVGFDILIAEEIAKDLGVDLVIKNLDFSGLLDALNSNNVDIILSGISPTKERSRSIDFSDIYYTAKNTLLTLNSNKNSIKSIDDLKDLVIGVQVGSIQDRIAQEKLGNSKIKALLRIPELVLELLSGKVDALLIEKPVAEQYAKVNNSLSIVEIDSLNPDHEQGSAVGIKKGQEQLTNEINKTISRLIKEDKITQFFNESLELSQQTIVNWSI